MIDLHIHTTYSDGECSVEDILSRAERMGLEIIAITDHNTIDAHMQICEDSNIKNLFSGKIITGIEIATIYNGEAIEILGYNFDINRLNNFLIENNILFADYMVAKHKCWVDHLLQLGFVLDDKYLVYDHRYPSEAVYLYEGICKHSENFKLMNFPESKTSLTCFARNELYNPKSPLYLDMTSIHPPMQDVIDAIHNSGGVAFLAHPYVYSNNIIDSLDKMLDSCTLDGIECYHSAFTSEQIGYLLNVCCKRKLLICGGSDFHGKIKPGVELGVGKGNLNIPMSICLEWLK